MTTHLDPLGIHAATRKAHAALGDEGIERVTGKSASLARNWADPNMDGHNIQLRQAIALDVAMIRRGLHPPHFEAFKAAIEDALPSPPLPVPTPPPSLAEQTLRLSKELGDVAAAVTEARRDGRVSAGEKRKIARQLEELLDVGRAMQRALR